MIFVALNKVFVVPAFLLTLPFSCFVFLMNNFGRIKKNQAAQKLIDHCGPKSFHEYLLIFPDACPNCGSRDWVEITWKINDSEPNQLRRNEYLFYSKCVYCEQIKGNFSREIDERLAAKWYTESHKQYYRVSSPYLSQTQNNSIVDWNWKHSFFEK